MTGFGCPKAVQNLIRLSHGLRGVKAGLWLWGAVDVVGPEHEAEQAPTEPPDRRLPSLVQPLVVTPVLEDGSPVIATTVWPRPNTIRRDSSRKPETGDRDHPTESPPMSEDGDLEEVEESFRAAANCAYSWTIVVPRGANSTFRASSLARNRRQLGHRALTLTLMVHDTARANSKAQHR